MSKRAAIYARVSTDDQRGNYSIPTQVAECMAYVKDKGYKLVGNHHVDPQSGRDCIASSKAIRAFVDDFTSRELSRPGINATLNFLEGDGFDVLVVHAIDRLARDPYIRQTLEREFGKRGARVEFVHGSYDETPEGEVRKDLDATFAKWENAKRLERVTRGKNAKAQSGLFVCGRPPYGYRLNKDAVGGMAVEPAEAAVIRRIFQLFANENYSIGGIRKLLNAEGIKAGFGGKWGDSSVAKVLNNETYDGRWYYNRRKHKTRTTVEFRAPEQWIPVETTPLIDHRLWKLAHKKLIENRTNKRSAPKYFYLLGGMVFCARCQRIYAAQTALKGRGKIKQLVATYRHRVSEGHCLNRGISGRKLETRVWDEVVKVLLDPVHLREGCEDNLKLQEVETARQQEHLKVLRESTLKLEAKRDNLTKAYIDPDIKMLKAEYVVQRDTIEAEIKNLQKQIADEEEQFSELPTAEDLVSLEAIAAEMRWLFEQETNPTPEEKRQLLQMLHIKVWIHPDGESKVTGWYTPKEKRVSSTSCIGYVRRRPLLPMRA